MKTVKYQLNKTSMQRLQKELKNRYTALPTLKSKETALRTEVKKAKSELESMNAKINTLLESQTKNYSLWLEYPTILRVQDIQIENKNIAGVKVPFLSKITFYVRKYSLYANRAWIPAGTEKLKELTVLSIERDLKKKELDILTEARKKTTQKVNLYEKVQIPAFTEAITRIKRFLEDEENLARAGQKIIKSKKQREESQEYKTEREIEQ